MRLRLLTFVLLCAAAAVCIQGCDGKNEAEDVRYLKDVPLETHRYELLDVAFSAASAMPAYPHIKNRSRAQEAVVKTCLELEQPQRAVSYIERIDNWRRGAGYAEIAFYCALRGSGDEAARYLDKAVEIAGRTEDWRRDRIRSKIAETYAYLGQTEEARRFEQGVELFEKGKVAQAKAMICPADAFDEQLAELEELVSSRNFDIIKNALGAYAQLYNRFYSDEERREIVEQTLKASWSSVPISNRIDLLIELAVISLDHSDPDKALDLVNEAEEIVDSADWRPRFEIPLRARLAELRFNAGDEEQARADLREALAMFDDNRGKIVNIYRAGALRPIAEAYQATGEPAAAREIYMRTLEAGIENPNSRPRAEDLMATCCSMALHAVEPDSKLLSRIREIHDGLGDPW